jgi:glycosyltransferase involved in cell wall biosynthesis
MQLSASSSEAGRVLIVTPQPFYEDRGTPITVRYVAAALSELGADVDVLAFPIGTSVSIPRVRVLRSANPMGLRHVPIGFSWRKIVLDVSLWRSFARLVRTRRYQIVHAVEEAGYMASLICPLTNQPFIYDMASAIPQELKRNALFKNAVVQRMLGAVERRVIQTAHRTLCSSGLARHVLRQVPDARVSEWRYPAHTARVDATRAAALRMDLGIRPDQRVILFMGNFSAYQGIDLLIDAFQTARRIRPELVLVCVGGTRPEMAARANAQLSLLENRIFIVPRQPREQMPVYLKLADYLVLPRVTSDNVPLKLFDYMASGKPIVATRGHAHEPLLNSKRAFLSESNATALSAAIVEACETPQRCAAVGQAAQAYAREFFGWDRFVESVRGSHLGAMTRGEQLAPVAVVQGNLATANRYTIV